MNHVNDSLYFKFKTAEFDKKVACITGYSSKLLSNVKRLAIDIFLAIHAQQCEQ